MAKGIRVVIDLQFFKEMTEKEQNSLFKQLTHCHSENRNAKEALNLTLTSTTPEIFSILDKKYSGSKWGITIHENDLIDSFKHEEIVYLSGDAE